VLDTGIAGKVATPANDVLRVHDALDVLAKADPRLAQVVELRYFGGMTEAEIAQMLGTSERTVRRDWEKAKLLLFAALG
jgi:RNA polymerase sigma factor (sigma-70 family)